MSAAQVWREIEAEMVRAVAKFPTWPTDPLHALAVLGEEFGELTKDVLQLTYEPHKTTRGNVRAEAIQTAAMAIRFALSLDRYEYAQGGQHVQGDDRMVAVGVVVLPTNAKVTSVSVGGVRCHGDACAFGQLECPHKAACGVRP